MPTYELVAQIDKILNQLDIEHSILAGSKNSAVESEFTLFTVGQYNNFQLERKNDSQEKSSNDILVLDEADRLFNQNISILPYRQVILVSATLQNNVKKFLETYSNLKLSRSSNLNERNWEIVDIRNEISTDMSKICTNEDKIRFYRMSQHTKLRIKHFFVESSLSNLILLLKQYKNKKIIVFCNTINSVNFLHNILQKLHFNVSKLHGKMLSRKKVNDLEIKGNILVTSGLLNRGYDFQGVKIVIEYEIGTFDERIHRIGRTGRNTRGYFISLSKKEENMNFKAKELFFSGKRFRTKRFPDVSERKLKSTKRKIEKLFDDEILKKMAKDALKSSIKYNDGNKLPIDDKIYEKYGLESMPPMDFISKR